MSDPVVRIEYEDGMGDIQRAEITLSSAEIGDLVRAIRGILIAFGFTPALVEEYIPEEK